MESQDAGSGQKPLSFGHLEDIPDIDSENTSHAMPDDVMVVGDGDMSVTSQEKNDVASADRLDPGGDDDAEGEVKGVGDLTSDNREVLMLDAGVVNCDKVDYDDDKIQEESSCPDDTPLNSLSGDKDDGDQCQDYVTHSLNFALRSEVREEELVCKKMDSSVEENKTTESQSLLQSQDASLKLKSKTKKVKKSSNKDGRDSDSSVSSRKRGKSNKTRIKSKFAPGSFEYIEERLRGRIFSGWIEERKWVENLAGYRDVVEVDEWEMEMNQALMSIIRSVPGVLEGSKWINITSPTEKEPCYCMWTLLGTPPNPGHYWFSVSGVAVHPQFGLKFILRIIRSIHPHDGELAKARRVRRKELAKREPGRELETLGEQVQEWLQQVREIRMSSIWSAISSTITISNIRETIRFVIVLSMTIVVGIVTFIRESHHYGLQFLHAAGVFFCNITPFLQSLLSFAEKIVGGMYLLIAMVYNDVRRPSPQQSPPHPVGVRPPMAIAGGQGFGPSSTGPRTVKYVPPEQWVYKSQNSPSTDR